MGRLPRVDAPGSRYHLFNRGIARRVVFGGREDFRWFLCLLARTVRLGLLEVESYALLPTHFHLLVESPEGRLSDALEYIGGQFSKGFNRRHRRDGPLWRGRFGSRRVLGPIYRGTLVRYFDQNCLAANLASDPFDYPWGSAWHYGRLKGPPWLNRAWPEAVSKDMAAAARYAPEHYRAAFGGRLGPGIVRVLRRRLLLPGVTTADAFDDMVASAPDDVRRWMWAKAWLADQTAPTVPILDLISLSTAVRHTPFPSKGPARRGHPPLPPRLVALAGLAEMSAGASVRETASLLAVSEKSASRLRARHRTLLPRCAGYAESCTDALSEAVRLCVGVPGVASGAERRE